MDKEIIDILNTRYRENRSEIKKLDKKYCSVFSGFWDYRLRNMRELFFMSLANIALSLLIAGSTFLIPVDFYVNLYSVVIFLFSSYVIGVKFDREFESIYGKGRDSFRKSFEMELEKSKLIQRNKVIRKMLNKNQVKTIVNEKKISIGTSLDDLYERLDLLVTKLVIKRNTPNIDDIFTSGCSYAFIYMILANTISSFVSFINANEILLLDIDIIYNVLPFGMLVGIYDGIIQYAKTKKIIKHINDDIFETEKCRKLDYNKKDYMRSINKCINEIVIREYMELEKKEEIIDFVLTDEDTKEKNKERQKTIITKIEPKIAFCEFRGNPEEKRDFKVKKRVNVQKQINL